MVVVMVAVIKRALSALILKRIDSPSTSVGEIVRRRQVSISQLFHSQRFCLLGDFVQAIILCEMLT